jgi:hypothetical protein
VGLPIQAPPQNGIADCQQRLSWTMGRGYLGVGSDRHDFVAVYGNCLPQQILQKRGVKENALSRRHDRGELQQ